ncbi:hypothetical protein [Nonomuraea helvata]|uniref:Uncharacterized protein n=1 Tax=Nonomuraea helvata TaxID=37484 RepID=A0ABV5SE90_9ACTN
MFAHAPAETAVTPDNPAAGTAGALAGPHWMILPSPGAHACGSEPSAVIDFVPA